jgi:hypothetical protein
MIKRGFTLFTLVILLTGCFAMDQSLMTGLPCSPPCWYGIVPGETHSQDALDALRAVPFVKEKTIEFQEWPWAEEMEIQLEVIDWESRGVTRLAGGQLYVQEDVVTKVDLILPVALRLGKIIEAQGPPELAGVGANPDASLAYSFAYPQKGLLLSGTLRPPARLVTQERLAPVVGRIKITHVTLFSPMDLTHYYSQLPGFSQERASQIASAFQPWPGLNTYMELFK